MFGMKETNSSAVRLAGYVRRLCGVLAVLFLASAAHEIAVRGFGSWKFIVAATGFSIFLGYSAATGRPFWPYTR
jgi:hypothetical protein